MASKSRQFEHKKEPPKSVGGPPKIWYGRQVTISEGHKRNPRTGKYAEGGPFFTFRTNVDIPTTNVNFKNKFGEPYNGPIWVSLVPKNYGGFAAPSSDNSFLDPIGADAIAAVDPTDPNAQTGVALGEIIKDRRLPIPVIGAWKRRTEVAKAASGEYLNAVFGWLPLVNDMKNTAQSVLDGNTIMENYQNASGSNVHREFAFPDIESESETVLGTTVPETWASSTSNVLTNQDVTVRTKSVTKRWFSGTFTYQAASSGSSFAKCLGIGTEAEKLFGISLTPELIWELTPWSWAIDWFSNTQSVIHNATSFAAAGLVMRYGYVMEESSTTKTYSMPDSTVKGQVVRIPPATVTHTVKRRQEANPFGFGIGWEGLSPTQLAISAALGITRLR
jgi:hypothetical protein